MKWKSVEFQNIQSWENGKLEFNENGLTVIEAKSETGKSVFIKCLRLGLYFEQYNKKTRTAIIRDYPKNSYGTFSVTLEDNTLVVFRYYESTVKTAIRYPNGEMEGVSRENISKIAKLLNLITCKDSVRILNILDNETPMLYDTTDMEYNTNVMSLFLDHEDLRTRKKYAIEFSKRLQNAEGNYKFLLADNERKATQITANYNIEALNTFLANLNSLNEQLSVLDLVSNEIQKILTYKLRPTIELDTLLTLLKQLKVYADLAKEFSYLKDFKYKNTVDLTAMSNTVSLYNKCLCLLSELDVIQHLKLNRPVIQLPNFTEFLKSQNQLCEMREQFEILISNINDVQRTEEDLAMSKQALYNFKQINKTCPLCGQLWEEDCCESS